jgi:hypothetical protein
MARPTIKELEKGGLGAGGALGAAEAQLGAHAPQRPLVHQQVLQPQTRPLSHRRHLRRSGGQNHVNCHKTAS